ncbi:MAG: hypothetical protein J6Q85_02210 [Clostridia bacterium]|nr:hypothetical protein [Clostridia bacterium]
MTQRDKIKLERLSGTFLNNYKITNMYSRYLENAPTLLTKEMIDTLTKDGDITKEEAIVGLLCEAFSLDFENPSDKLIIRDYLTPSIKVLSTEKYENNPYYKHIRVDALKGENWEFKREVYPPYRAFIRDDMILADGFVEIPPLGFFDKEFEFLAVLENGNEWMTLTPVDLDTCERAIDAARGKVITFGLGLGYYAYMVSEKAEVESITVVEKSEEVIKLFTDCILPKFPNKDKVKIINADAFEYAEHVMPNERYDLAFVDTWRDASDGEPMYRRMKGLEKLNTPTPFMYWIENFLISRARALRFEELLAKITRGARDAKTTYDELVDALINFYD